jgi:hypothetical protein
MREKESCFLFTMNTDTLRIREGDIVYIKTDTSGKRIYWRPLTPDGKAVDSLRGLYKKWEWALTEEIFNALAGWNVLEERGENEYVIMRKEAGTC